MFHQFSEEIQKLLIVIAMEDALETTRENHESLELQHLCCERKADFLKEINLEKTKESLLDAIYYYKMYMLDACWKGNKKIVKQNLKELPSKSAKL